jgi:hypothetical protein
MLGPASNQPVGRAACIDAPPPGIEERVLRIAHFPSSNWNFVLCFARNTNGKVEATDALGRDANVGIGHWA